MRFGATILHIAIQQTISSALSTERPPTPGYHSGYMHLIELFPILVQLFLNFVQVAYNKLLVIVSRLNCM